MKTPQVADSLGRIFREELQRSDTKRAIVFWYDAKGDFENELDSLELDGITLLRLDQIPTLELKILLETNDPSGSYLIYAPFPEPAAETDWLIDIRLYSRTFVADKASVLLDDLGLANLSLKEHLIKRESFFRSQDRLARLKRWVIPEDSEGEIDLKMLAILTRADHPDTFNILMKLLNELHQTGNGDVSAPLKSFAEVEKFGLDAFFWDLTKRTFGYEEPSPTLPDLLNRLLITDMALNMKSDLPASLRHFELPSRKLATSATAFVSQWRGSVSYHRSYNALADSVETEMKIDEQIANLDEVELADVQTFQVVERQVVRQLRDHIVEAAGAKLENLQAIISQRRAGHWTRQSEADEVVAAYSRMYDAIEAAAKLLALRQEHPAGMSFPDAVTMYKAYEAELYQFDQLYRQFYEAADEVELHGADLLKGLQEKVESCYSNWFIPQVAANWGQFLDTAGGLLQRWKLKGVPNQQDFYRGKVESLLTKAPESKVYVIISDAFRFEAAEELRRELNSKSRFRAKLESQLGVLPSYTALGMAALLPHQTLDYKIGAGLDVVSDAISTASADNRRRILEKVQGTAIRADDLMAMSRDEGREFVKPFRVIYIYHNKVDAVGDSASTESATFRAVRETINDISRYVARIINELNGSQVLITADHGFLFQDRFSDSPDRSGLQKKPAGTLKAKKRYLLGRRLGHASNIWHGAVKITAGIEGDMEFWVPKGANKFHFIGGARFVHGGAMLQEIVVPIITVRSLRGTAADTSQVRQVDVSLLGSVRRIVNNVQRFEFIQTEAVSERVQPRTLVICIRDGDQAITNEVTVTFESESGVMDQRKKSVQIFLKAGKYDKRREYSLVLRDVKSKIDYLRIPVSIDLTFTSDF
jgi:uncharacterized protein (TIGR02687 family)